MNAARPQSLPLALPVPVSASQRAACLYVWDVDAAHTGGVTDSPTRAAGYVWDELQDTPVGAEGVIRCVTLAPSGRPNYVELCRVAVAHHESDGGVSWVRP